MKDRNGELDTLLAAWKRQVLPARFPDLGAALPTPPVLSPAWWQIMERIWSGADWRDHVAPYWGQASAPGA